MDGMTPLGGASGAQPMDGQQPATTPPKANRIQNLIAQFETLSNAEAKVPRAPVAQKSVTPEPPLQDRTPDEPLEATVAESMEGKAEHFPSRTGGVPSPTPLQKQVTTAQQARFDKVLKTVVRQAKDVVASFQAMSPDAEAKFEALERRLAGFETKLPAMPEEMASQAESTIGRIRGAVTEEKSKAEQFSELEKTLAEASAVPSRSAEVEQKLAGIADQLTNSIEALAAVRPIAQPAPPTRPEPVRDLLTFIDEQADKVSHEVTTHVELQAVTQDVRKRVAAVDQFLQTLSPERRQQANEEVQAAIRVFTKKARMSPVVSQGVRSPAKAAETKTIPAPVAPRMPATSRPPVGASLAGYVLADSFGSTGTASTGFHETLPNMLLHLEGSQLGRAHPELATSLSQFQAYDMLTSYNSLSDMLRSREWQAIESRLPDVTQSYSHLKDPTGAVSTIPKAQQQRTRMDILSKVIAAEVQSLRPGQRFLIPGGWEGRGGAGHAMIYEVERQGDGSFAFTVIDTGMKKHEGHWVEGTKLKHSPVLRHKGITPQNMTNPALIKNFMCVTMASDWSGNPVAYNASAACNEIYGSCLPSLGGQRDASVEGADRAITAQRSGTCAHSVLGAFVAFHSSGATYQSFTFDMKVNNFESFAQEVLAQKEPSIRDLTFLRRVSQNLVQGAERRKDSLGAARLRRIQTLAAQVEGQVAQREAALAKKNGAPRTLPTLKGARQSGGKWVLPRRALNEGSLGTNPFQPSGEFGAQPLPSATRATQYAFDVDDEGRLVGKNGEENLFLANLHMAHKQFGAAQQYIGKALAQLPPGEKLGPAEVQIVRQMVAGALTTRDEGVENTGCALRMLAEGLRRDSNFFATIGLERNSIIDKVMRAYYQNSGPQRQTPMTVEDEKVIFTTAFGSLLGHPVLDNRRRDLGLQGPGGR